MALDHHSPVFSQPSDYDACATTNSKLLSDPVRPKTALIGARALIVEDEAFIAELLGELLEEMGCTVVATARRLDEAERMASVEDIDFATLDVNLAGSLSYPAARILCRRGVPFIFATGYGKFEMPAELKAAPILVKPFSMAQIRFAIECVLR